MLDSDKNKRLKELTELIAAEQDTEKFTLLVAELNDLIEGRELSGQRSPRKDSPATLVSGDTSSEK